MKPFDLPLVAKSQLGENNTEDWRNLSRVYDNANHVTRQGWTIIFNAQHMREVQVMAGALHEVLNEQHRLDALTQFIIDRHWLPL